jgi:DNA-binding transcriptional regulator GbsR (MarR family)
METLEHQIGEAAGKIWNALNANGPLSKSAISKKTKLSSSLVEQGIGWLAREGKLVSEKTKRGELIRLKEQ